MKKMFLACVFFLSSLSANALEIYGTEEFDLYGGESFITVYDSATLTTHGGSSASFIWGQDNSTINIQGGDISWLQAYDNNTTNISFVDDLSWLLVRDNSIVNIFGSDFSYASGHLSGIWSNGNHFSFWALEESNLFAGGIGDILPDNIILHSASVPESSSMLLFMTGMLFYFRRKILHKN